MRELLTSHSQACWKERIQKETAARVAWNISYGHKYLKERSLLRKQPQQGAPRPALGTAAASSSPDNKQMQGGWPETEGVQNQLSRELLFRGISHEGQGRALYLRERRRQKPQEKYRYPVLSSWEYGWHVGDAVKDIQAPTYGRSKPITKNSYIGSGIFHCPRRADQLM